jgi:hypothetical protein
MSQGNLAKDFSEKCNVLTHLLVGGVKVRRNQPQGSKIGLKIRTRQNFRGSYRSRGGICQRTNENLYCIFCLKNAMYCTNESVRGNGAEHSA